MHLLVPTVLASLQLVVYPAPVVRGASFLELIERIDIPTPVGFLSFRSCYEFPIPAVDARQLALRVGAVNGITSPKIAIFVNSSESIWRLQFRLRGINSL